MQSRLGQLVAAAFTAGAVLWALTTLPSNADDASPAVRQPVQAIEAGSAPLTRVLVFIQSQQRKLYRQLSGAIRDVRNQHSWAAFWGLVTLSFAYGVFHAAGPGHGKVVLSAYLLTHRTRLKRGLIMATASAALQGIVAIGLVETFIVLMGWTHRQAFGAVGAMESASYALITIVGIGLTFRPLQTLWRGRNGAGGHNPHAGHSHAVLPDSADASSRSMAAVVLSVGIRPCSGAVLVLLFAHALQIRAAGIGAVGAMSFGTALTVASLALLAVYARRTASSIANLEGRHLENAVKLIALFGGILLAALGAVLFLGSLGSAHPLL